MTASRFECPRCQTVFVKDIAGDAAFVECPSCGALALPAGDATGGALERALSGPHDSPSSSDETEMEQQPAPSDPSAPVPGMFQGLLEPPASLPEGQPVLRPLPPPPAPTITGSITGSSITGSSVTGSQRAPELDFNFGQDLEIDLPSLPPPPTTGMSSREGSPLSGSGEGRAVQVHSLPPDAMQALAAQAESGPTSESKAPWSGLSEDAFGDLEKAFDEMALKPVAPGVGRGGLSTDEERFLRGDSGEQSAPNLRPPPRRASHNGEHTDRNSAPPRPPPRGAGRREKRARPSHFELSAEARALAFLPIRGEGEGSVSSPRPRLERADFERVDRGPVPETSSPTARPV
ncbi:MAG TPA: hypothetical protein VGO62_16415, partial [Myxococcota bacterium]